MTLQLSDKRFNSLHFSILSPRTSKINVDASERLMGLKSVSKVKDDRERTLALLVFLYDKNSPLHKHYPSLEKRQRAAAELAGFDFDVKDDRDYFEIVMSLDAKKCCFPAAELVLEMLEDQNDELWDQIVANEAIAEVIVRTSIHERATEHAKMEVDVVEKKAKLLGQLEEVSDRIKRLRHQFYLADPDLEAKLAANGAEFTPEAVAGV